MQRYRSVLWTPPEPLEEGASVSAEGIEPGAPSERLRLSPYQRGHLGPGSDEDVRGIL